jgi:outer membrane protein assembly factor BamB
MKPFFILFVMLAFFGLRSFAQSLVWELELGEDALVNPVAADNRVYLGTHGGGHFYVLNAETGEELWSRHDLEGHVAPVRLDGDVLYLGSSSGILYALHAETGEEIWQIDSQGTIFSMPLLLDGVLIFTTELGRMIAVNAEDGSEIWNLALERPIIMELAVDNGRLFGAGGGTLYAVEAETGEILWENSIRSNYREVAAANGRVFLGTDDGRFYALDAENGEILWEYEGRANHGAWTSPFVYEEAVYVGNRGAALVALSIETGALLWTIPIDASVLISNPIVAEDVLYFGAGIYTPERNVSVFYAIDTESQEVLWEYEPVFPVLNKPTLDEAGRLYLANVAGSVEILQVP